MYITLIYSDSHGSSGNHNAHRWLDQQVFDIVVHWATIMPKMSRYTWRRYIVVSTAHQGPRMPRNGWNCKSSMKWLLRLTGEPGRWEWLNLYGIVRKWLLGLTGDHDHSEITRSNCGSYSGPNGSLRMQNNQDGFDITLIYSGSKGLMGTYDTFNGSTSMCMI